MNEFRDWDLDELVGYIATEEWGVPVRAMEAVLERGAAAVEPLVAVLEEGVREEEDTDPRFWAVVVLGELRDSRAAPALAEVIRHAGAGDIAISFAAAEALAKLGAPALPALRSLAAYGARHQRHWALYAAGQIDDDAVFAWLLEALQTDHEMADVIALALSDQGRPEAVQPILQALETAEAWQRPELEDALLHLHGLRTGGKEPASDWRLRYRWQPGLGFFPLNWATVSAVVEHQDRQALRGRAAPPPRPLDEILEEARREQEAPERCDCCDTPTWMGTGVPVCPQTTAGVSFLQARMLEQMAEEEDLHDLFDMLDEVEGRLARAELETGRASPAARRRRENLSTSLRILLAGCYWLIEQGVETVGQGVVRLQAEAERAAEAHGTPLPLPRHSTASSAIGAPPLPAAPRAGRNEPCPCGSGRKFKKCCGSAGG